MGHSRVVLLRWLRYKQCGFWFHNIKTNCPVIEKLLNSLESLLGFRNLWPEWNFRKQDGSLLKKGMRWSVTFSALGSKVTMGLHRDWCRASSCPVPRVLVSGGYVNSLALLSKPGNTCKPPWATTLREGWRTVSQGDSQTARCFFWVDSERSPAPAPTRRT